MTLPTKYDLVVPLHLIPVTVAQRIRERGDNLYRISIIRTHGHQYTVKCKCRAKIAVEPPGRQEDCFLKPDPGPVSGPSGGDPGPEQLSGEPGMVVDDG
jgi:hypothetical protein